MNATVAKVNAALLERYGRNADSEPLVRMHSGRSYYYFVGDLGFEVESLYVWRISSLTLEQVMGHVKSSMDEASGIGGAR
jgi:hypothetical protein